MEYLFGIFDDSAKVVGQRTWAMAELGAAMSGIEAMVEGGEIRSGIERGKSRCC